MIEGGIGRGRLKRWKVETLEGWKVERLESWKVGGGLRIRKLENWKIRGERYSGSPEGV
jgi:hypothetical protein